MLIVTMMRFPSNQNAPDSTAWRNRSGQLFKPFLSRLVNQDDEFLPAVAGDDVGLPHDLVVDLADRPQHLVAELVSVRVIQFLEVVDVAEDQSNRPSRAAGRVDRRVKGVRKKRAVVQARRAHRGSRAPLIRGFSTRARGLPLRRLLSEVPFACWPYARGTATRANCSPASAIKSAEVPSPSKLTQNRLPALSMRSRVRSR